jgi:hypothetical protein
MRRLGSSDMGKKPHPGKEIELLPDAWERFERAVKIVAKSPPQHRTKADKSPAKRKSKKKAD